MVWHLEVAWKALEGFWNWNQKVGENKKKGKINWLRTSLTRVFGAILNKQLQEIQKFRRCQLCLFILLLWYMQGVVQWLTIHSEVLDILTNTQITQIVFLRFLFRKAWWLILPLTNFTWRIAYLACKYWFLACYYVVNIERGPATCITFLTEWKTRICGSLLVTRTKTSETKL